MKTYSFILSLLLLFSCGKNNTSGHPKGAPGMNNYTGPLTPETKILSVQDTMNGIMVQGTTANFAIPLPNRGDYNYRFKDQLVVVTYQDRGPRVKIYNAIGKQLVNGSTVMQNARVTLDGTAFAIEYYENTRERMIAMNSAGQVLVNNLVADKIRADVNYGIVAVTYKNGTSERVLVVRDNGQLLVSDTRSYITPRVSIEPYDIIIRHSAGVERIPH
jgi:hypothetical protein